MEALVEQQVELVAEQQVEAAAAQPVEAVLEAQSPPEASLTQGSASPPCLLSNRSQEAENRQALPEPLGLIDGSDKQRVPEPVGNAEPEPMLERLGSPQYLGNPT